jgi:hypothetical protein
MHVLECIWSINRLVKERGSVHVIGLCVWLHVPSGCHHALECIERAHYLAARLDGTTTFSQVYQEQSKRSFYPMEIQSVLACGQCTTVLCLFYITLLLASTLR